LARVFDEFFYKKLQVLAQAGEKSHFSPFLMQKMRQKRDL